MESKNPQRKTKKDLPPYIEFTEKDYLNLTVPIKNDPKRTLKLMTYIYKVPEGV
jgi:hypothetical protein